jgi:serine/threonine protein kinase
LGCVIYEVCALDRLFPTKDAQDKPIGIFKMMDLIRQGDLKDIPSMYSDDLKKLVKKMLVRNPEKRPKAEDLLKDKLLVQLMINRIN